MWEAAVLFQNAKKEEISGFTSVQNDFYILSTKCGEILCCFVTSSFLAFFVHWCVSRDGVKGLE